MLVVVRYSPHRMSLRVNVYCRGAHKDSYLSSMGKIIFGLIAFLLV